MIVLWIALAVPVMIAENINCNIQPCKLKIAHKVLHKTLTYNKINEGECTVVSHVVSKDSPRKYLRAFEKKKGKKN